MIRLEPAGAEALLLVLADEPDADLPPRIAALAETLRRELGHLLLDLVPSWTTLLLHYDLTRTDHLVLAERVEPLLEAWLSGPAVSEFGQLHEIPIWYCGEDLAWVAEACGLSIGELVDIHSSAEYRVGAIGFSPGFAYLGGLDSRLALPRRSSPRIRVPAGSLAIAERQTAIYPQASPGGWHLLGLCPWTLFDAHREPPCPLALGDRVRFFAIDEARYRAEGGGDA
ncbi:5-oxoprolinase subunit PxpB [Pseudomonas sp. BN414]|uniref:5-oxoprolinase subunit PxpB n=1 Tax=Pseudomonas sp. BN414 TaxID=2567888 RepID=UPI0024575FF0|nr:5-oxoprolinase subunit PxpB [Pseudomonas sp. BN414]MDH4570723.1 5-oxoprolinase subunit PxpB [Pseudomonas sp. BN414]